MSELLAFTIAIAWVLFILAVGYGLDRLSKKLNERTKE